MRVCMYLSLFRNKLWASTLYYACFPISSLVARVVATTVSFSNDTYCRLSNGVVENFRKNVTGIG